MSPKPGCVSLATPLHWEGFGSSPGLLPLQPPCSCCSSGWHHRSHNVYWSLVGLTFPLSPPLLPSLSTSLNFQLQTSFQKPLVDKSQGFINVYTVPSQVTVGEESCQTGCLAFGEAGHKYLTQWVSVYVCVWQRHRQRLGEEWGQRELLGVRRGEGCSCASQCEDRSLRMTSGLSWPTGTDVISIPQFWVSALPPDFLYSPISYLRVEKLVIPSVSKPFH